MENSSKDVVKNISESLKKELLKEVPAIGNYLSLGVAQGLKENDKHVVEAFRGMLEKLKYQRDFDIISEEEYYRSLENLRDRYFSKGTQNWVKYTGEIYAYQKELLETESKNITKLYGDVANYAEARLGEILKRQQQTAAELNSFGGLFDVNTVTINGVKDEYTTLHDLEYDIDVLKRYGAAISEIKSRIESLGIENEGYDMLMSSINQLDSEDALRFATALVNSEDKEFSEYVKNLLIKNELAEGISAMQYEKDFSESVEDVYVNMKQKLSGLGYEIPEEFLVSGSISAQKFGEAFVEGLDSQLESIRSKIEAFNASLKIGVDMSAVGNVYNTTNTSYNIQSVGGEDTVEQIRRLETVKRLSGIR